MIRVTQARIIDAMVDDSGMSTVEYSVVPETYH
jgi:hypothetical protein